VEYNTARQSLDSLTAAYLTLPNQSRDKVAQGLTVMAAWSELAINAERLRLQKTALSLHNEQLKQLAKEGAIVPDRLSINTDDLQQLKQEIEVAGRELSTARENSSQLEASPVPGNPETDEGKAKSLLFEQRVRHNAIKDGDCRCGGHTSET
jgi:hypothetical protein